MASLYLLATALGLLRDLIVVRRFGFGSASDAYFNYTTVPLLFLGVVGYAGYLPLSIKRLHHARRFVWCSTITACLAIAIVLSPRIVNGTTGAEIRFSAMIASVCGMACCFPRLRAAALRGELRRMSLVQNAATLLVLLSLLIPALGLDAQIAIFALSLPIAMRLCLSGSDAPSEHDASAPTTFGGNSGVYLAATVLYSCFPMVERVFAVAVGTGVSTAIALASKVANVPIGFFGMALGISAFVAIVSQPDASGGTNPSLPFGRLCGMVRRRPATSFLFAILTCASLAAFAWAISEPLVSLLGGDRRALDVTRPILTGYLCLTPFACIQALAVQERLAQQRFRCYAVSVVSFYISFLAGAILALATNRGVVMTCGLLVGFLLQSIVLGYRDTGQ